jgi:hypothetical protein
MLAQRRLQCAWHVFGVALLLLALPALSTAGHIMSIITPSVSGYEDVDTALTGAVDLKTPYLGTVRWPAFHAGSATAVCC